MNCDNCLVRHHCKDLDSRISRFYRSQGIKTHGDITLHAFDTLVDIQVIHRDGPTYTVGYGDKWRVWLENGLDLPERRVRIAHEIGHALLHSGSQLFGNEMTKLREEEQARRFALYALVPTCFLLPLLPESCDGHENLCAELAEAFGVPEWFMRERCMRFREDGIAELVGEA